jgi:predicted DNA-binding transcriptional regulator AlpA
MSNSIIRFPKIVEKKPLGLMTSIQVRELFDISKSTLYRWSNVDNILPKLKVGRRVYFKRDDIENLLKES